MFGSMTRRHGSEDLLHLSVARIQILGSFFIDVNLNVVVANDFLCENLDLSFLASLKFKNLVQNYLKKREIFV